MYAKTLNCGGMQTNKSGHVLMSVHNLLLSCICSFCCLMVSSPIVKRARKLVNKRKRKKENVSLTCLIGTFDISIIKAT